MLTDQIDKSLDALRTAILPRRELGDVRAEGEGLHQLSNVLWCPGRVAEAGEAAREAVAVLEGMEPGPELAMAYCRLAQLCMDAEDVEGAVDWGTRALELSEALGDAEGDSRPQQHRDGEVPGQRDGGQAGARAEPGARYGSRSWR